LLSFCRACRSQLGFALNWPTARNVPRPRAIHRGRSGMPGCADRTDGRCRPSGFADH
jgi:hypothetical protein